MNSSSCVNCAPEHWTYHCYGRKFHLDWIFSCGSLDSINWLHWLCEKEFSHCKKSVSCNYADHILHSFDIFTSGPSYSNCRLRSVGNTSRENGTRCSESGLRSSPSRSENMQQVQGQGQSQVTRQSQQHDSNSQQQQQQPQWPAWRAGSPVTQKTSGLVLWIHLGAWTFCHHPFRYLNPQQLENTEIVLIKRKRRFPILDLTLFKDF